MDKREEIKRNEEKLDLDYVLANENGRRFLWRLLSYCGLYQDIDVTDPNIAMKSIGRRNVGLFLTTILAEHDELKYFKMMQEARNRAIEEERKNAEERKRESKQHERKSVERNQYQSANRGQGIQTIATNDGLKGWL